MNILYLTNLDSTNNSHPLSTLHNFLNKNFQCLVITENCATLNVRPDQYDLIIKDRYPFSLNDSFYNSETKILSLIPTFLPHHKGTNSIFWSAITDQIYGGSLFYLYDNNYTIDVIRRYKLNMNDETLRSSFIKIFSLLHSELILNFNNIISNKIKPIRILPNEGSVNNDGKENLFIKSLPLGYDTKLNDLRILWDQKHEK